MIAIVLMLLMLPLSFLLFGGLVRFSESIIRPSSAPSTDHLNNPTDGAKTEAKP
jgi:hypothetical protein